MVPADQATYRCCGHSQGGGTGQGPTCTACQLCGGDAARAVDRDADRGIERRHLALDDCRGVVGTGEVLVGHPVRLIEDPVTDAALFPRRDDRRDDLDGAWHVDLAVVDRGNAVVGRGLVGTGVVVPVRQRLLRNVLVFSWGRDPVDRLGLDRRGRGRRGWLPS